MAISKAEVNFRRLLAAAPQQQNQAKLIHYVATLREQLEQLAEEKTPEGLPRISRAKINEYSEKIEDIASKIATPRPDIRLSDDSFEKHPLRENSSGTDGDAQAPASKAPASKAPSSPRLRRRPVPSSSTRDGTLGTTDNDATGTVKLDTAAQAHIEKHRKLQEDLTDEMVVLARQLKERSMMMSQSLQNTETILDSTEKAVEQSLASTGHANVRAMKIYSETSKTSCFTWLLIFLMTCIFIMVVLLIRVT